MLIFSPFQILPSFNISTRLLLMIPRPSHTQESSTRSTIYPRKHSNRHRQQHQTFQAMILIVMDPQGFGVATPRPIFTPTPSNPTPKPWKNAGFQSHQATLEIP